MKKTIVLLAVLLLATPAATEAPRVNIDVGMTVAQLVKTVYDDAVGSDTFGHMMRYKDNRYSLFTAELRYGAYDLCPALGVEHCRRLVEHDDLGFHCYNARYRDALLLTP